ncbi:MAG: nuclear transport factor 2 family protein [Burkholderiales bacterium]|nr:nuclear transport factor 2 family protein [Burkholderiales bacterium]MDE2287743.1 nuclear transport factor 2 family protein [Burkholderiales bacterium]MDE2610908.1 nuclear transport factor 2 family protein [Burkholderiales bacterium]
MATSFFLTPDDAEQAFYEALNRGDVDALMDVWSEDEDVVCIHPAGPRVVGVGAVRSSWEQILAHGSLDITVTHRQVARNPLCAIHSVIEQLLVEHGPQPRYAFVVATNIYLKEADGWRLVLHHASPALGHEGSQIETHGHVFH